MHDEIDNRPPVEATPDIGLERDDLNAEYERLEAEYQYQKQLQDERDEAEPELHSCGYPDNSFACKIRHQYIQHGWAKGDH